MGRATVTTRIDEAIIKQLEEIYQKPGTGASVAAEAYVFIRRHTLRELKGMFSREELMGIISNLNGTMQQPEFQANPVMFAAHLEDGELYELLGKQYSFDFEILMQKVKMLTSAQVFFLQEEIRLFWDNEGRDLEKFIKDLTPAYTIKQMLLKYCIKDPDAVKVVGFLQAYDLDIRYQDHKITYTVGPIEITHDLYSTDGRWMINLFYTLKSTGWVGLDYMVEDKHINWFE